MSSQLARKSLNDATSALQLLRAVRDAFAAPASPQERLNQVTRAIANSLQSEVCSVYLLRAGDVLELFASEGLNANAVHNTRLNVGEGLVGDIAANAEILNLAEAAKHPRFAYRPETGEEIYHSFVGVPILQGGHVIGVLVVQGKAARSFSEEQVEVLQTVAMVLSELAVSSQFVSTAELQTATSEGLISQARHGISLSPGLAHAPAVLYAPELPITQLVATDIAHEEKRLGEAIATLQASLDKLLSGTFQGEEQRDIVEAYLLFIQDKGWRARIDEAIRSGLTAEAAVRKVQEELHAKMSQLASTYIRERMQDLEDLSNRLIAHLLGVETTPDRAQLPEKFILVARSVSPAELLEFEPGRLVGLILEAGSSASHIAVIARAMDIPAVGHVEGATSAIQYGEPVILNGDTGEVFVRPSEEMLVALNEAEASEELRKSKYAALKHAQAVTKDHVRISLQINAGLIADSAALEEEGVDGIGLYRTELPYMTASNFPSVDAQAASYRATIQRAKGKRVVFRSFDIGGDKTVPYLHLPKEENPAMGWRATRIGLDRPRILAQQFRALLRAAAGETLYVMFPFIADVHEFDAAKALLLEERANMLRDNETPPEDIRYGAMVEIPSILWQIPALLARVDFLSLGSNDLFQFLYACDRGSAHMADRYDMLSPPFLRVIQSLATQCHEKNVELSFCGEMARKPEEALALLACGIKSLSVPGSAIGPLKAMIGSLHLGEAQAYLQPLLQADHLTMRSYIQAYARDHGIAV